MTAEGEPGSGKSSVGAFLSHFWGSEDSDEKIPSMEFAHQVFTKGQFGYEPGGALLELEGGSGTLY